MEENLDFETLRLTAWIQGVGSRSLQHTIPYETGNGNRPDRLLHLDYTARWVLATPDTDLGTLRHAGIETRVRNRSLVGSGNPVSWQPMKKVRLALKALQFYPAFWLSRSVGYSARPKAYRRFVLACAPRIGSNLLRSLLNAHTAVVAVGDVFRSSERVTWDMPLFATSASLARLRDQKPESFLTDTVFGCYPSRIRAMGCKLLYEQVREGEKRRIWGLLAADPELRVIHLKRRDLLRCFFP